MTELALITLLIVFVAREVLFQITTQRLINKIMSRNFTEYSHAVDHLEMTKVGLAKENQLDKEFDEELQKQADVLNGLIR